MLYAYVSVSPCPAWTWRLLRYQCIDNESLQGFLHHYTSMVLMICAFAEMILHCSVIVGFTHVRSAEDLDMLQGLHVAS